MVIDGSKQVDWHGLPEGLIVQEFIPGTEYGPMVFGTPAHDGAAPFVVSWRRPNWRRAAWATP